ncbi:Pth4p SKDI_15G0450 [Saccharomyces kudriavzevii IFO 1802]|uniref:Uncharacterized protein n=2 Tax=Saccharomyces kudriavzevii (strain ATCC MYA-4449 / AS 2.2408 / CBS 8840 / NBRC 1802 / NCYC 2889) TaxID=226230 RepID=A0AA35NLY4_SACK1|nr:uncharacterized protein SKDI_15G0450 [Saccharomyces kudriavzevii IFO 1802]EJT41640.1 YOL114C-like protein [Saccharomyces kudriavzevii IFO 1802]CAI4050793.1 hypothetical protein SKDI_15G0450 [Saccharomyces kudriavzevii IFO 1802]
MTTFMGNFKLVRYSTVLAFLRARHCKEQLCIKHTVRLISNEAIRKKPELVFARDWLKTLSITCLPSKEFVLRYDRASGPGGQNVNKVNSKCTLTLPTLSSCAWIPHEVRNIICSSKFRYYTKSSDSVVIQSDETRSRETNKLKCFEKLVHEIKQTCQFPNDTTAETTKKWTNIKEKSNKVRLLNKKAHGDKKKNRCKIKFNY